MKLYINLYIYIINLNIISGAKYIEGCAVEKVSTKNGRINSVVTNLGQISCEIFVNCAGMVSQFIVFYIL